MGPNPTGHIDCAAYGSSRAPATRRGEWGTKGPFFSNWVENQRARESREKIASGGGDEDEVAGDGDGLDGEVAGDERRVAEEEAERWVGGSGGKGVPVG